MAMQSDKWQNLLDQFSQGSGQFFFPKAGKTRIRLVAPPDVPEDEFFVEVTNSYGRKRWIVLGYVVPAKGQEEETPRIRPVVVPKTVMKYIFGLLAEGYDLFSDDHAHGITIIRTGSGQKDTTYNVIASAQPQALPEGIEWPEEASLEELAAKFALTAQNRGSRGGSEEDEETSEAPFETEEAGEEEEAPRTARPPKTAAPAPRTGGNSKQLTRPTTAKKKSW